MSLAGFDTWLTSGCEYPGDDAPPDDERDDDMPDMLRELQQYVDARDAIADKPTMQLVSLRNAIDIELRRRVEEHTREAKAAQMALDGTKPRARRSDAGRPREKKEAAA